MKTKEQVYDDELSPLMAKILEICKRHKIAMIADFALDAVGFHCTSAIMEDECQPLRTQLKAWALLKPQQDQDAFALAETVETMPDGSKRVTIKRIT